MSTHTTHAWVTLVMLNDNYVPGALVLAQSLHTVGTQHKIVCMTTPDITKYAKQALALVFDLVVVVPYIHSRVRPLPGAKQKFLYDRKFLEHSFTKWNCLMLLQFDSVCFVDADISFARNPDAIFQLPAPAGSFTHPWSPADPWYGWPKHGDLIPHERILHAMLQPTGFAVFGSMVLLNPDGCVFMELKRRLAVQRPYGDHVLTISGPDELLITELHVDFGRQWKQLGVEYHAISWKNYGPHHGVIPLGKTIGFHFHGKEKPWEMGPDLGKSWPDLKFWWSEVVHLNSLAAGHVLSGNEKWRSVQDFLCRRGDNKLLQWKTGDNLSWNGIELTPAK